MKRLLWTTLTLGLLATMGYSVAQTVTKPPPILPRPTDEAKAAREIPPADGARDFRQPAETTKPETAGLVGGNGVVEPGEACDGASCDAVACVPTGDSVCAGGVELAWGTNAMLATGPNLGFDAGAACGMPVNVAGYLDMGPLPWRLVRRWRGGAASHFARLGCGAAVGACVNLDVSDELPPHAIVWLGVSAPYTTGASSLDLQRVRYGSFFIAQDDFADSPSAPTDAAWVHDATASTWKVSAMAPIGGTLASPAIPLAGLEPPIVVHYLHNLSALAPGAEARLEVQLDDGPFETLASYAAPVNKEEEHVVPDAAGHATLRARFVVDAAGATGTTTWVLQNFFVGPPFAP
jgi:hypothetical protein